MIAINFSDELTKIDLFSLNYFFFGLELVI